MSSHAHTRYQAARNVTLLSVLINALLGVLKCFFGVAAHSHALLADGVHSFSDLLSDAVVLFAAKVASQDADLDHPYGHARVETAATVALSMLLVAVAGGILWAAVHALLHPALYTKPTMIAIWIAGISVFANEFLYRYTAMVAKRIGSNLLQTNAWHSRSDAASSLIVIVGVAGSLLGYPALDAIAAMVVGLFILRMAWRLGWSSVQELVDTGLDEQTLTEIKDFIRDVPGVVALHQLRTRSMAGNVFVDVHVLVAPRLSVSEGHYIGESVQYGLIRQFSTVMDVTVHVDPEDDEVVAHSKDLPSRVKILEDLAACWGKLPGYADKNDVILHYLDGQCHVVLVLALECLSQAQQADSLREQYRQSVKGLTYMASVTILYR
ncbi:MAG: cation diffusion facilitator transporter [marine bacterium B5-7]|nr:MAG: cation diffusion facilitator transporter [marine bacterium B5-7]